MKTIKKYGVNLYLRIVGIATSFVSILLIWVLVTGWEIDEPGEQLWVICLQIFFLVSSIILVLSIYREYVIITETGIRVSKIFRKEVFVPFDSIQEVRAFMTTGVVTIKTDSIKISINNSCMKIDKLLQEILDKTGREKFFFGN
jgi:uncharacterized protein with HEPN domain